MNQPIEWLRLSARIKALGNAAETLWRGVGSSGHSSPPATGWIFRSAVELVDLVENCRSTRSASFTVSARIALDRGISELASLKANQDCGFPGAIALITALLALESELTYHLTDFDSIERPVIERALFHLQRLLVVDPGLRSRWKEAFEAGETSCEQLGAVHLLHHGIYAFKTNGTGERTDLILGEKLVPDIEIQRATRALVLTEWKVVREHSEVDRKVAGAVRQAKRYCEGILQGFEVQSVRYILVVSNDRLALPPDTTEHGVLYRNVNIAIEPSPPSRGVGS